MGHSAAAVREVEMMRERIKLFIPCRYPAVHGVTGGCNVEAVAINEHFATHFGPDAGRRLTLTHRHTGGRICGVRSDAEAERIVAGLMALPDYDWSDPRLSYHVDKFKTRRQEIDGIRYLNGR